MFCLELDECQSFMLVNTFQPSSQLITDVIGIGQVIFLKNRVNSQCSVC